MRQLFEIDTKDYNINGTVFSRPSSRGIIIRDGKLAMIHSMKYDYYKFPGGGIEDNEDRKHALVREVREETGLTVKLETVKEFGMVHRIQKGDYEDVFIQDNYYYICETEDEICEQSLDDYEKNEGFTLEYVTPDKVIETDKACTDLQADQIMLQRECRIIEILVKEGYIKMQNCSLESEINIREYSSEDVDKACEIWNSVVRDGEAFPQEELLDEHSGEKFFKSQTYTGIAEDISSGEIVGLYILHPNNVGRCGHICNASYAVRKDIRGRHIGEKIVFDCLKMAKKKGFRIMQFNAVVATNTHALHLYERIGFKKLGVIPGGFRMPDGHYEDIIPHYYEL